MNEPWWIDAIKAFVIINLLLLTFAYMTLVERKVIGLSLPSLSAVKNALISSRCPFPEDFSFLVLLRLCRVPS